MAFHSNLDMSETNSVSAEPTTTTTLTVHILIDGREILPDVLWNEAVAKGVLIGGTHEEPRSVHALNETTFLVTYSSGIVAEEIGCNMFMCSMCFMCNIA